LPGFDERLRQHLEEVAPPADASGAFDRILEKKIRRRLMRRFQVAGLAFIVVAATVGGTFALARVFRSSGSNLRPAQTPTPPGVRNGRIAFLSTRGAPDGGAQDIYTVDPGTGDVSRVTRLYITSGTISWSPVGTRLVFDQGHEGGSELDIIGQDGTGLSTLTKFHSPQGASWSPDGRTIAFYTEDGKIYAIELDQEQPVQLTHPGPNCSDLYPSWSPDGSRIAFVESCGGDVETYSLMVMHADGGGSTPIADVGSFSSSSSWSPDGTKIVFSKNQNIVMVGSDGQNPRYITRTGWDSNPVWAPDGTKIAFDRVSNNNSEIYIMNPDGTGQTNITNDPSDDFYPSWQPIPVVSPAPPTPTSEPSPTPSPLPANCDASQVTGDFDGDGQPDTATVAKTECFPRESGSPKNESKYSLRVQWPPAEGVTQLPDCANACQALASADLNLDGIDEFILKVYQGSSSYIVQVYELPASEAFGAPARIAPPGGPAFPPDQAAQFQVGGSDVGYWALGCFPGNNKIIAEVAKLNSQHTEYAVHKTELRFDLMDGPPFGRFTIVSTSDFSEHFDPQVGPGDQFEPGGPCWMEQP
jgi:WD40 repeat protein